MGKPQNKENIMKAFLIFMSITLVSCTNNQAHVNQSAFNGFDPVNENSQNMARTSLPSAMGKATLMPYARIALNSKFVGVALSDPKYFHWCTSPLEVDGKIHLFNARWKKCMDNWKFSSEIAHYVSDQPEGPFSFVGTVLSNKLLKHVGYASPHNPRVEKVDGKFIILFTVRPPNSPKAQTQQIGMAVADTIYGPWKLVGKDGIVLSPSKEQGAMTYQSKVGVSNSAFIKVGTKYHIYFKYKDKTAPMGSYGVAVSDHLEGPYVITQRCMDNLSRIEDAQAFEWNGCYYLLTDDNHGKNGGIAGAQVLWKSTDGLNFKRKDAVISSGRIFDYRSCSELEKKKLVEKEPFIRHPSGKFERPAFLFQDGKPTYFYGVSNVNINGGKTPEVYVLRLIDNTAPTVRNIRSENN